MARYLCELDVETFQFIGERTIIWDGALTRSKWIEAPHIYKKDSTYYLMVVEGGIFVNHRVMMAKAGQERISVQLESEPAGCLMVA